MFKVVQTPSEDGEPDGNGFDSGPGSANGMFEHQFNDEGTFYYTTGLIDMFNKVEMRGKIVVEAKEDFVTTDIKVTRSGIEANLKTGSGKYPSGVLLDKINSHDLQALGV